LILFVTNTNDYNASSSNTFCTHERTYNMSERNSFNIKAQAQAFAAAERRFFHAWQAEGDSTALALPLGPQKEAMHRHLQEPHHAPSPAF
jgi:hypothetical protein